MSNTTKPLGRERRRRQRFSLRLGADCTFHNRRAHVTTKSPGQIQNVSARGCCLNLTEPAQVKVGMIAELRIDWPATIGENVALKWHVRGRVVRVDGHQIAVAIRSYQFRLKGNHQKPASLPRSRANAPGSLAPSRVTGSHVRKICPACGAEGSK